MYDGCFGLTHRPFAPVPQLEQYFAAGTIEAARTTLARCIERAEGTGFVVGPSGTGKTLLCLMLAEQFRKTFQVAMLASGRLGTRRALFQAILYELGRPYRYMDEGELRLAIVERLTAAGDKPRGMLLLIDEAHTLPPRLLDEIRLLSNLAQNGEPLVRLVLSGGPALEERFASPKLDSFSQRLSARCYLEAFNRTETQEYIRWQIDAADGVGAEMFSDETCQSVFQATGGVPRLINQVCDHALLLADVAGQKAIAPALVEEAWADLQQLPTPWSGESKSESSASGVIEFGSLDDSSESPAVVPTATATAARVFRVASVEEEEEARLESDKPDQQIHRIEQLLAEADDDFQPAGSIHPEIELRFEDALHPFQEDFEHEEVVSDRYAAPTIALKHPANSMPVSPQTIPSSAIQEESEPSFPLPIVQEESASSFPLPIVQEESEPSFSMLVEEEEPETSSSLPVAEEEQEFCLPSPVAGEGQGVRAFVTSASSNEFPSSTAVAAEQRALSDQHAQETSPPRHEYKQLFARMLRG